MREHARSAAWNLVVAVAIGATILELLPDDSAPASSPVVFVEGEAGVPPSPADLAGPASAAANAAPDAAPEAAPDAAPEAAEVRLAFAGDIMQHASQSQRATLSADAFEASYAGVAPILRRSDIVVGNLEFPVLASKPAGPDDASVQFNGSPAHLDALAGAGFNLLSTSNNHAYDQGMDGLRATIAELEKRGIGFVGSAPTRVELEQALVVREVRGVRIAFFAYTGLLNTYLRDEFDFDDPPADLPLFFANFAEWSDEYREHGRTMFRRHVERARTAGADLVVALTHWGDEWRFSPTADQRAAAEDLVDAGYDLVVGGHGHVLNSPAIVGGRLVVYSLGNFLCDFSEWQSRTGALLEVTVQKPSGGTARVADFRFHPILVRRDGHVIEPLDHSAAMRGGETQQAWGLATRLLGKAIAEDAALASR